MDSCAMGISPGAPRITRATPADAALLGRLHSFGWRAAYQGIVPDDFLGAFSPEKRAAYFERMLPQTQNEHYIAWLGGEAVGMLALGARNDEELDPGLGEIFAIYLLPAYYGKGLGRALMGFAMERLRALGFCGCALWVLEDNTRARRFYHACGFAPDGRRDTITLGNTLWEMRYVLAFTKGT